MSTYPPGIYDLLRTVRLQRELEQLGLIERAEWHKLDPEDVRQRLAVPLSRDLAAILENLFTSSESEQDEQGLENIRAKLDAVLELLTDYQPLSHERLNQIKPPDPFVPLKDRPDTPLAVSALLTGSARTPALRTQLIKELATCDRADWLVSFIKYSGVLPLLPTLQAFTMTPAPGGGPRLRIATTSYMGATDLKAIQALLDLPNTEIRMSFDTRRTRLHAKVYLFHRDTKFGSAYIGSANVSKAALDEGLEWTAKISQYETNHLWQHAIATFDSHWEDPSEFTPFRKEDLPQLRQALSAERGQESPDETTTYFDLRPYDYQRVILQEIEAERSVGRNKHLVIAATGTGKTMIAAFDYKAFCAERNARPRLLFVAHREEILKQACATFRQVLRDGNFGDIIVGGAPLNQTDHLFCTVQSWNSRDFSHFTPTHFKYVVLDEAHHASADSYQRLIDHIQPDSLLGLTATPERMDGKDIREDFGGAFTHEIRLPEAIERALLSPFHYYGIPDLEGLDFSATSWRNGGYDRSSLSALVDTNRDRARWVMVQTERHVPDLSRVRGLGFCVSVAHAEFMAEFCRNNGVQAIALTADSPKELRQQAQRMLENYEIRFIFTVDLYNEGVDIPFIDTVLFLRPTESLTLFLQQLGRGLRIYEEKAHLTVLDFIAPQHRNFNFARRFQALSSRPELRIDRQVENGMPYVPTGCLIHLEEQAQKHVLNNIRNATASLQGDRLYAELRRFQSQVEGKLTLQKLLNLLNLDTPDELYRRGLPHLLLAKADGTPPATDQYLGLEDDLASGFRRLAMMDDTELIEAILAAVEQRGFATEMIKALFHSLLWRTKKPWDGNLEDVQRFVFERDGVIEDLRELMLWLLEHRIPLSKKSFEPLPYPLTYHASYNREQILLSLGYGTFDQPRTSREGVLHIPEQKLDVFFADINKSEADFSPTTMYEDYAITDKLFHWQSQSATSDNSEVGLRYIHHQERGYTPLLFIRERKRLSNGLTTPYFFAGPLRYRKHEGSKPISFVWELEEPLPARAMTWARRV